MKRGDAGNPPMAVDTQFPVVARNRAWWLNKSRTFVLKRVRQWGIEHVYADQLTFDGHHSEAALLGVFNVSVLHNIVHLAFGLSATQFKAKTQRRPLLTLGCARCVKRSMRTQADQRVTLAGVRGRQTPI